MREPYWNKPNLYPSVHNSDFLSSILFGPEVLNNLSIHPGKTPRFILVEEFFRGRFEVTDIGTGETVISDLSAAMWLD